MRSDPVDAAQAGILPSMFGEEVSALLARDTMVRELMRPLRPFLCIAGATEVVLNQPEEVFVEVGAQWRRFDAPALTLERCMALAAVVATYTEQAIGALKPIMSATLPDGERIQVVLPPAVESDRVSISIRIPASSVRSLSNYEEEGAFDRFRWVSAAPPKDTRSPLSAVDQSLLDLLQRKRLADFLQLAVRERKNIAVVGNTGSGKTTLMKSLCQSIPREERLTTIEDVRELFLPSHPNRVHLLYSKGGQGVAQVTPGDLINANMRMKPDRVLLAELRGAEAFDFLKLLTTGHSGSITSYHAESCALAFDRYVFMCKEHEQAATYDASALKRLVQMTIDVTLHVIAAVCPGTNGDSARKERYVAEVHFDPYAKLQARFDSTAPNGEGR